MENYVSISTYTTYLAILQYYTKMGRYFVIWKWLFHYTWDAIQPWKFALFLLDGSRNGYTTSTLSAKMYFYFSTLVLSLPQRSKINMWTLENQYLLPLQPPLESGLRHTILIISQTGTRIWWSCLNFLLLAWWEFHWQAEIVNEMRRNDTESIALILSVKEVERRKTYE